MFRSTQYLQKYIPLLVIILTFLLVLSVGHFVGVNKTMPVDKQRATSGCVLDNQQCQIVLGDGITITVTVKQPIEIEESIDIVFETSPDVTIESAWVEGVNMFMGKVPLLVEARTPEVQEGWFMLGACSEPNMQWQMTLNIKGRDKPAFVWFDTHR